MYIRYFICKRVSRWIIQQALAVYSADRQHFRNKFVFQYSKSILNSLPVWQFLYRVVRFYRGLYNFFLFTKNSLNTDRQFICLLIICILWLFSFNTLQKSCEIHARILAGNRCHYALSSVLSSRSLKKKLKIKIYEATFSPP